MLRGEFPDVCGDDELASVAVVKSELEKVMREAMAMTVGTFQNSVREIGIGGIEGGKLRHNEASSMAALQCVRFVDNASATWTRETARRQSQRPLFSFTDDVGTQ